GVGRVVGGWRGVGGGGGGGVGGGARVEVAVGDQFPGPQAGPKQQPVPFAAPGGEQAPDDAGQPGRGVRAAVAGDGGGGRWGRRPGQAGDPPRHDPQPVRGRADPGPGGARAGPPGPPVQGRGGAPRGHGDRGSPV